MLPTGLILCGRRRSDFMKMLRGEEMRIRYGLRCEGRCRHAETGREHGYGQQAKECSHQ